MVAFYFYRVKNGKTAFSKVPKPFQDDVKTMLIENGFGHLVEEAR